MVKAVPGIHTIPSADGIAGAVQPGAWPLTETACSCLPLLRRYGAHSRPVIPSACAQRWEVIAASSFSTTWSMVKLAAFWRGGNSLNVSRN